MSDSKTESPSAILNRKFPEADAGEIKELTDLLVNMGLTADSQEKFCWRCDRSFFLSFRRHESTDERANIILRFAQQAGIPLFSEEDFSATTAHSIAEPQPNAPQSSWFRRFWQKLSGNTS
jgi:hypothetical protein